MLELFTTFTVSQIIIFTIMLALAIKGGVDFFDWCKEKYQQKFDKDYAQKTEQSALEEHYIKCREQHQETVKLYSGVNKKLDTLSAIMDARFDNIEKSIDKLTESDMHDIKGWIVEKHHTLMKRRWVDDFTMDTLEKRFTDYVDEGGNSYVKGLMDELRALPHMPPEGED